MVSLKDLGYAIVPIPLNGVRETAVRFLIVSIIPGVRVILLFIYLRISFIETNFFQA